MNLRKGTATVNSSAGADLLWHGHLRRHREGQEDQDGGPAEPHRRHHGPPHRVLHHQRDRDRLLSLQVDPTIGNQKPVFSLQAGRLFQKIVEKIWCREWRRRKYVNVKSFTQLNCTFNCWYFLLQLELNVITFNLECICLFLRIIATTRSFSIFSSARVLGWSTGSWECTSLNERKRRKTFSLLLLLMFFVSLSVVSFATCVPSQRGCRPCWRRPQILQPDSLWSSRTFTSSMHGGNLGNARKKTFFFWGVP